MPELLTLAGLWLHDLACEQFGVLDSMTTAGLAVTPIHRSEGRLYTRLADGGHVNVSGSFIGHDLEPVLHAWIASATTRSC